MNYQNEYFYKNDENLIDYSFCLLGKEGNHLARINLNILFSNTSCQINSSGLPINPPNFAPNVTDSEKKGVFFDFKSNHKNW